MVEAQQPEADHEADAENGVGHAEKVTGPGNLLLVKFALTIFHGAFKSDKNTNEFQCFTILSVHLDSSAVVGLSLPRTTQADLMSTSSSSSFSSGCSRMVST